MDGLRVARHRLDHPAVEQVPQLDSLVLSSTGQISTIRTDGEAVDRFVVAHKDPHALPTLDIQ